MKKVLSVLFFVAISFSGISSLLHAQAVSDAQKQNVQKLAEDFKAIKAASKVTDEMKQNLANDLMAVYGNVKNQPVSTSAQKLAQDLAKALDDSKLSDEEINQLSSDLASLMSNAKMTKEQVAKLLQSLQTILKASNVDANDLKAILADLQAVRDAIQKG